MPGDFIDSNVFIYLFDDVDVRKRMIAENLITGSIRMESGVISFQVVQETLCVITTKLKASPEDEFLCLERVLSPLWQIMPSTGLYARVLGIQSRYQFSFYDALIVAAALEAGCSRLLTEDLHHGQELEGLRIENPSL